MREILFRGFHPDKNGEEKVFVNGNWVKGFWVYGYYVKAKYHWHKYGIHEDFIIASCYQNGGYFNVAGRHAVIPETVGQYTGLKDKNGKKIFEGDVIDTLDRLIKVVWLKGNAQFDLNFVKFAHDKEIVNFKGINMRDLISREVIGNIFENLELLKGGEE